MTDGSAGKVLEILSHLIGKAHPALNASSKLCELTCCSSEKALSWKVQFNGSVGGRKFSLVAKLNGTE